LNKTNWNGKNQSSKLKKLFRKYFSLSSGTFACDHLTKRKWNKSNNFIKKEKKTFSFLYLFFFARMKLCLKLAEIRFKILLDFVIWQTHKSLLCLTLWGGRKTTNIIRRERDKKVRRSTTTRCRCWFKKSFYSLTQISARAIIWTENRVLKLA
jgi:hypothetical protein